MVKVDGALDKVAVSADGKGMVGLAGAGLLALCADRVGLTAALSRALWGTRRRYQIGTCCVSARVCPSHPLVHDMTICALSRGFGLVGVPSSALPYPRFGHL